MQVICKIRNLNNANYPELNIRKLYQVVFLQGELNRFEIFTALVLGAKNTNHGRMQLKNDFNVEVSFSVYGNRDVNPINVPISFTDLTNDFLKEPHGWRAVWGKESKIVEQHNEFNIEYEAAFGAGYLCEELLDNDFILIKDKDNPKLEQRSLAFRAQISNSGNSNYYRVVNNRLAINTELPPGIEVFCWTKTVITVPNQIENYLKYSIELSADSKFNCYDTSIYFIPPSGFKVDKERLTVINKGELDNIENLSNPLQLLDINLDKYFTVWIKDLSISDRSIYRAVAKELQKNFDAENTKVERIDFSIPISNYVNPILIQFLSGLLVSLFFAYGLDQTRLMNYRTLFFLYQWISPDINFLFTFGAITWAVFIKLIIGSVKEDKKSFWARRVGSKIGLKCFIGFAVLSC